MRVIPHAELTPGLYWASYLRDKRDTAKLEVTEVVTTAFGDSLEAYFICNECRIPLRYLRIVCRLDPPDIDPQEAWNEAA